MCSVIHALRWLALTASLATPSLAAAGDFQASPVRLYLSERVRSELVTLVNRGAEPVRLQLSAHTWDESAEGVMQLGDTEALVVFPSLVTLAPGEKRRVRVGVVAAPATREASYRLLIEELPSGPDSIGVASQGVAIRMRLSIPVFAAPEAASPLPALEPPRLEDGTIKVVLKNAGTRHVRTAALQVSAEPTHGEPIQAALAGWYLLAGGRREYRVTLPPGVRCLRRLHVAVPVEHGGTLEADGAVADPTCTP